MPKVSLNTIGSRYGSIDALNDNFDAIEAAIENTLSLDGTSPNAMTADLDLNSNDLLNVGTTNTQTLYINGVEVEPNTGVSAGSAFQTYSFTATAGQTTFSVSPATPLVSSLLVSVNGLELPPADVTVSTTNVVIPACTLGDEVVIRRFTKEPTIYPTAATQDFQQAGAGAQIRTVQSRLRDVVSVKDFGAVGDGVADDTAAIQAADAAANGAVFFPAGTYKATTTITKRLGISWVGEGSIQGAQSPQQAKTKIVFNGPTSGNAITIDGATPGVGEANLKMTGIHFEATGASQDLITGVYIGVKICQIEGNSFTNFATGIKHNQVETWIKDNYFSSCPICIDSAGGESHVVDNHGFPSAGGTAILVRGSATNVRGNKFFGDGGGAAYGCQVWGYGNVIVGNVFDAFTDVGIRLISNNAGLLTDNNVVVGNNISGTGSGGTYNCGILIDTLAENVAGNIVVANSIFNKRGDRSMTNGVRINALTGKSNNNNIVAGNSIADCTSASVTITGAGTKTGNQIYDNGGYLTEASGTIAGYNGLTVNHGLASTPSVVIAIPESNIIFGMGVDLLNSTTFRLLMRDNTGTLVPSGSPVNVRWYARV